MNKCIFLITIILVAFLSSGVALSQGLTDEEQLGKLIFFDKSLSVRNNQSCASCHAPEVGFTYRTKIQLD